MKNYLPDMMVNGTSHFLQLLVCLLAVPVPSRPVPALCENILPYSKEGMTFVCITHVSPQLMPIYPPPFQLLLQFQWYKAYVLCTSHVEKCQSDKVIIDS